MTRKVVPPIIKKYLGGGKGTEVKFIDEEQKLVELLDASGGSRSIKDLSYMLDKSAAGVVDLAQTVSDKGISIWHEKEGGNLHLGGSTVELPPEDLIVKENEIRVGIIADTLLGSKYQQLTALHKAFQIAEHKEVDFMIHLGVSAGKPTAARGEEFHKLTIGGQINYIIENYPRSMKFKTRLISGYHDMQWQKERVNILAEVCAKRDDLFYRGTFQSDFYLRKGTDKDAKWPILRAVYRGGDTSPYAKSYPVQGFQENLIQNISDLFEDDKPDIGVVAGQGVYLDLAGESVDCLFSVPGMRTVSPSVLRKKNRVVAPTVGFIILIIKFNEDGTFAVKRSCYPLQTVKSDYKVKFSEDKMNLEGLSEDECAILKLLEKSQKSHGELAQAIDRSSDTVSVTISSLRDKGYQIYEPDDGSKSLKLHADQKTDFGVKTINFDEYFYKTVRRGGVSDTHLGSKVDLIPVQEEAYSIFKKEGITDVEHCGDVTNGPAKHGENLKGEVYEYLATPLVDLTAAKYPKRDGITTNMIAGDHDGWFMSAMGAVGLDLIRHIADLRPDINYLGIQKGEVRDGKVSILLKHYNWGTGYARSHKPQQVVETLMKEAAKEMKRHRGRIIVVLSGGGHVYCAMLLKGIVFILMPCLQGRTGFIDGLGKISDVGFLIYSVIYSKQGKLTEFSVEYFDRVAAARRLERKRDAIRKRKRLALKKPVKK